MEAKISFKLGQRADINKELAILMIVNCGLFEIIGDKKKYTPLTYPTKLKTTRKKWQGRPTFKVKGNADINTEISNFATKANEVVKQLAKEKELSNQNIKTGLDREYNPSAELSASNLNEYIAQYVTNIEDGTRLTEKNTRFAAGTVKVFKTFKKVFELFQQHKKQTYNFDSIDLGFYKAYTGFLTTVEVRDGAKVIKSKYRPNNVGGHVKRLKMIMNAARDEGLHNNTEIDKKKFKVTTEDSYQIYLTEHEIGKLYKLKLEGDLKEIRDVFLVGCYVAQRYGDYSRISKDNIKKGNIGNLLTLVQQKTKKRVVIPLERPELVKILKSYDYNLPYIYEAKLNENIKLIARMAGITSIEVYVDTVGGEPKEVSREKCTMVSSHTCRRSGCTNMYLSGMHTLDIMKISGHKTEKELLNYIRVSEEEAAEKMSTHKWFSEEYQPLKIAR